MALDISILTDAFKQIRDSAGKLSTSEQDLKLANAIAQFVASADVIYTVGLIAPSGGGPVTGPTTTPPTTIANLK